MATQSQLLDVERTHRKGLLRRLLTRRNIVGFVVGGVTGAALNLGLVPSLACGLIGRWAYGHVEQKVPFTSRVHIILLPSTAEALLGAYLYEKFVAEQAAKRTLLDKAHPDTMLVTGVAQRLIKVLGEGHGGGYQKHLRSFRWEVAVVNQPVMNAFVFPGGKICVYSGLLKLLRRDPDLLAMVMGHEIAHALARHSAEKMGLGLGISVALSILAMTLGGGGGTGAQEGGGGSGSGGGGGGAKKAVRETPEQQQQRLEMERLRRMYQRQYSRLVHGQEEAEEEEDRRLHQEQQQQGGAGFGAELLRAMAAGASAAANSAAAASGAAPAGASGASGAYPQVSRNYPAVPQPEPPGSGARYTRTSGAGGGVGGIGQAPPQLPAWMNEQMVQSLTSVLLELPFSRRAETEADLIGIKLMALAGYNANKGPEAFTLLAQAGGGDRRRHAGSAEALIAGLGCTHPDSNRRWAVAGIIILWDSRRTPTRSRYCWVLWLVLGVLPRRQHSHEAIGG